MNVGGGHRLDRFVRLEQPVVVALEHFVRAEQVRPALDRLELAIEFGQDLVLRLLQFGRGDLLRLKFPNSS